ncbi:MAG: YtxH domain-containing protein [Micrococcales bacterium]|nr:YtxH domain-containing protein [Micrococcales bacterium]
MKSTSAFVVGVGLGLLLGTKAGRDKLDQLKGLVSEAWHDPRVQEHVAGAEEKARAYMHEHGATLREHMNQAVHPTD